MNIDRLASAIVYFRILRSVGRFAPMKGTKHFAFSPCTCGCMKTEKLPNGLPEPVLGTNLGEIVRSYSQELGTLCREHYQENFRIPD